MGASLCDSALPQVDESLGVMKSGWRCVLAGFVWQTGGSLRGEGVFGGSGAVSVGKG